MQFREFLLSVNHGAGTENLLFAKNVLSARSFNGKESFAIPVLHRPTCWQIISSLDKTLAVESEREFIGPGRSLSWLKLNSPARSLVKVLVGSIPQGLNLNAPATSDVGVVGIVLLHCAVPSTSPRDTELRATEGRSRPLPVVMQFAQQWELQWAKGPT
ncbi:hypothetical protein G5I_07788 [Acromyrmex echinatior]|uniref:Uncharacterized protein n=1 Tax=Acromyrmex echinatior TaxID=103372 RepID=F4WPS4_ACREC|nr:hypothetical protein G5I_07788 [Acromyrmex echinatior]